MAQAARPDFSQHAPQTADNRDRRFASAFKPLALPALASAVYMSKQGAQRPEPRRDVPAILRKDAVLS